MTISLSVIVRFWNLRDYLDGDRAAFAVTIVRLRGLPHA
jgi:hypothetical protein